MSFDPFMTPIGFNRGLIFRSNRGADLYGVVLPRKTLYYFELFYANGEVFYLQITLEEFVKDLFNFEIQK